MGKCKRAGACRSARSENAHVECNGISPVGGRDDMPIGIALPPAGSLARGVACPNFWLGRCMYGNDSGICTVFSLFPRDAKSHGGQLASDPTEESLFLFCHGVEGFLA